jgi:hypothetical protein
VSGSFSLFLHTCSNLKRQSIKYLKFRLGLPILPLTTFVALAPGWFELSLGISADQHPINIISDTTYNGEIRVSHLVLMRSSGLHHVTLELGAKGIEHMHEFKNALGMRRLLFSGLSRLIPAQKPEVALALTKLKNGLFPDEFKSAIFSVRLLRRPEGVGRFPFLVQIGTVRPKLLKSMFQIMMRLGWATKCQDGLVFHKPTKESENKEPEKKEEVPQNFKEAVPNPGGLQGIRAELEQRAKLAKQLGTGLGLKFTKL